MLDALEEKHLNNWPVRSTRHFFFFLETYLKEWLADKEWSFRLEYVAHTFSKSSEVTLVSQVQWTVFEANDKYEFLSRN